MAMHTCCGSTHEWHLAGCSGPRADAWIRMVESVFDVVHFMDADNFHCEIFTPKNSPTFLAIRPASLTREQAKTMAKYLLAWSETGTLDVSEKPKKSWELSPPDVTWRECVEFDDVQSDAVAIATSNIRCDIVIFWVDANQAWLSRDHVERLINHLQAWLDTGSLRVNGDRQ